jgi:2-oxoglutarate ferredoxin oxidoreductase subunit alpha
MARMIRPVQKLLRAEGQKVGIIRPITLFPFPAKHMQDACTQVNRLSVFECNAGQMVEDVRIAVEGRKPVELYARPGGAAPSPAEIEEEIRRLLAKVEVPV